MAGVDIKRHGTPFLGAGMAAGKRLPRGCPGIHMDRNCISGVVGCVPGHRLALRHGPVPGHGSGQCRSHSGFRGRKGLFSLKLRLCRGSGSGPKDQLIRTVETDWQPQHQMNSRLRHPRLMPLVAPNRPIFWHLSFQEDPHSYTDTAPRVPPAISIAASAKGTIGDPAEGTAR